MQMAIAGTWLSARRSLLLVLGVAIAGVVVGVALWSVVEEPLLQEAYRFMVALVVGGVFLTLVVVSLCLVRHRHRVSFQIARSTKSYEHDALLDVRQWYHSNFKCLVLVTSARI